MSHQNENYKKQQHNMKDDNIRNEMINLLENIIINKSI